MFLRISIVLNSIVVFWNRIVLLRLNNILAFSRINNLRWILLGLAESLRITLCFFSIYTFLLFGILILYFNPSTNISIQIQSLDYKISLIIILTILSLGGVPPLLGFLGKVIILKQVFFLFPYYFFLILIFSSLIILFLYINFRFISIIFIPRIFIIKRKKRLSHLKSFFCFLFFGFTCLACFYI